MPLTLNVGLSKKVGEPNYGSRGASVNLEFELDAGVAHEPDRLRDRIRQMFQLVRDAISEELAGRPHGDGCSPCGAANGSPAGTNGCRNHRAATPSQVRALHAIAKRQGLDLPDIVCQRFHAESSEDLSLRDASTLIDELNGADNHSQNDNGNGNGNVNANINGDGR